MLILKIHNTKGKTDMVTPGAKCSTAKRVIKNWGEPNNNNTTITVIVISEFMIFCQCQQFARNPYAPADIPARTSIQPATRAHYLTQVHSLSAVLQMPSTQAVMTSHQLHTARHSTPLAVSSTRSSLPLLYPEFISTTNHHWSLS